MRGRLTRAPKIKDVRECRIILRFNKNFLRVELKFLDFRMYFTSFQIIDSFDYYSKRLTLSLSVVRRIILPPPHPYSLVFFVFRLCKSSTDFYVKRRASETDDSEHVSSAKNAILYYASFHRRNSIATCEQLNSTERKQFASLHHHHHH